MSYVPISTREEESTGFPQRHDYDQNNDLRASLNDDDNNNHRTTFQTMFTHIPEACKFHWVDDFYQGKHGIVVVCDRNAELAGKFQFWLFMRLSGLLIALAILYYLLGNYVSQQQNGQNGQNQHEDLVILDDAQAIYFLLIAMLLVVMAYRADLQQRQQHVAITTEGIRIDHGTAMTIIIPFENIQSCEAHDTTKYMCNLISVVPNLSRVHLVRTLAPLEQVGCRKTRRLELYGIIQAQDFVDLIHAMQDAQEHGTYQGGGSDNNNNQDMEMISSSYTTTSTTTNRPNPNQQQPQPQQQMDDMPMVTKV